MRTASAPVRPIVRAALALAAAVLVLSPTTADAKAKSGQKFSDSVKVGGEALVLNGLGVREATMFKVDVYVAGLYLKERSSDPKAILKRDDPWRLQLKFVRDVERGKLVEAWNEGFAKVGSQHDKKVKKLNRWMKDREEGDVMTFTYEPRAGTEVRVDGKKKGVLPGAAFARDFLGIWLGEEPPNAGLKKGLLGS